MGMLGADGRRTRRADAGLLPLGGGLLFYFAHHAAEARRALPDVRRLRRRLPRRGRKAPAGDRSTVFPPGSFPPALAMGGWITHKSQASPPLHTTSVLPLSSRIARLGEGARCVLPLSLRSIRARLEMFPHHAEACSPLRQAQVSPKVATRGWAAGLALLTSSTLGWHFTRALSPGAPTRAGGALAERLTPTPAGEG